MTIDEKQLKAKTIPNPVVTGGIKEIGLVRIPPIEIPQYLFMHPVLPRGIEMKANRMIKLVDENLEDNIIENKKGGEKAKQAKEYCKGILDNSGGPLYLKKMAQGAYRFGTSFSVLQTNVAETEVLRFEYQHEIFFGPATYPKVLKGSTAKWGNTPMSERKALMGKMKINPQTKKIAFYTQLTKQYPERSEDNFKANTAEYLNTRTHPELKNKSPGTLVPVGNEFPESQVIQLAFDTLGDEPLGISLVQFLHLTVKYLLNMEQAGAQAQVNFGFNKWVANTPFKDHKKMQTFGSTLSNIQKDSVVVLPEGINLKNITPGTTEFDKIHPIYLQLLAIRLGIPMPLLVQSGTETNKATITEMRKDMYEDFIADELTIEKTINDGFFKACKIKWPDLSIKDLDAIVPKFKFKQPPEDKDVETDRDLKFSLTIRNYSMAAQMWGGNKFWQGDKTVTQPLANKVIQLVNKSIKDFDKSSGEPVKNDKK